MKKIFTLIAAVCLSLGGVNAQDVVELSGATYDASTSDDGTWHFTGTDITIQPDGGRAAGPKTYPKNPTEGDIIYSALNIKKDSKQSIILPSGTKLYRIQITGFSMGDNFDYIYAWGTGDKDGEYEWTDPIGKGIMDNAIINGQAAYPIDPCGYVGSRVPESTREIGYIIADIDFGSDPYEGEFSYFVSGNNQASLNYTLYLTREAADAAGTAVEEYTYTNALAEAGSELTIVGAGSFVSDATFGKAYQNVMDGAALRSNYLLLPDHLLSHSVESQELTIGFWVSAEGFTPEQYTYVPFFAAYAQKAEENSWPMMVIQSRGLIQENCSGWCDFVPTQNVAGNNTVYNSNSHEVAELIDGGNWLEDQKWHYVTLTLTATDAILYMDGEVKNAWKVDGVSEGQVIAGVFNAGADLKYICLGGNQAWNWADPDSPFKYAHFLLSNKAYSADKIQAQMAKDLSSTGISAVKADQQQRNGIRYNLAGQQVDASYKGLVIMNGRKYMNK